MVLPCDFVGIFQEVEHGSYLKNGIKTLLAERKIFNYGERVKL